MVKKDTKEKYNNLEIEHKNIVRGGLVYSLLGNIGMYSSFMWGLYSTLKNPPEIDKIVYAGLLFGVSSIIKYIPIASTIGSNTDLIKDRISRLEKNLIKEGQHEENLQNREIIPKNIDSTEAVFNK